MDLGLQHPLSSIVLFLLAMLINIILGGLLLRALHAAEETPLGADQLPDDNSSWNWGMAFFNAAHVTADPGGQCGHGDGEGGEGGEEGKARPGESSRIHRSVSCCVCD